MKTRATFLLSRIAALVLLALQVTARAEDYTLSVPDYEVNPGTQLVVPISLDNAAGLAQVRVQLNFDPQVLRLDGVDAGPLGEQFDLSHASLDGSVALDFARATELAAGAGQLARLTFTANAGATVDLYSDLAIAEFEIGDASGVRDLTEVNQISIESGSVSVTLESNIDNAGNGIPDWWEIQYELDLFASIIGEDLDGDSLDRLLEFAFGGNPRVADFGSVAPRASIETVGGDPYQVITLRRRTELAMLDYLLEDSSDLLHWTAGDLESRRIAAPIDLGGGMESVSVRARSALDALGNRGREFMRITVDPQDP